MYKRQLLNDAGPSTPVEITGLTAVPEAGDLFEAVADERLARELAEPVSYTHLDVYKRQGSLQVRCAAPEQEAGRQGHGDPQ